MSATIDNLLGYETRFGHRLKLDEFGHFEASFLDIFLSLPMARGIVGTEHAFMDGRGVTFTLKGLTFFCRAIVNEDFGGDRSSAWDILTILGETSE